MKDVRRITMDYIANVHEHFREGLTMEHLFKLALEGGSDVFGLMPNTSDGLTTAEQVSEYVEKARSFPVPSGRKATFIPFLMITEQTTLRDIDQCMAKGIRNAKVYPRDRTTKSHNGVRHYAKLLPIIIHCGKVGMKVHFHPEHPWMKFGNRDAEFAFLPIIDMFLNASDATLVWEHGTDAQCIPFWRELATSNRFGLTLTAHHLAANEDQTFGDVRATCKPPIKTEYDRSGLVDLVACGHRWIMLGPDGAFHPKEAELGKPAKHVDCGQCACGAYTAPDLPEICAHALDKLLSTEEGVEIFVNFTSRNARLFHELPPASGQLTLVRATRKIPMEYQVGNEVAMPFWANKELLWCRESRLATN